MSGASSKISLLINLILIAGLLSYTAYAQTSQNPVQSIESSLVQVADEIIAAIPSIIVFIIIIIIGYIVADIVAKALDRIFRLSIFFNQPAIQGSKDLIVGSVKAIIIVISLGIAFSVLNLGAASVYAEEIARYLPSLAGAIALLTLGITLINVLVDFMYGRIKSTYADPFMDLIFNVLRFGLYATIIVIAVDMAILYWFPSVSPYLFYDIIMGSIVLMITFAITDRAINTIISNHPEMTNLAGYARLILYVIFLLIAIAIIIQPFYDVTAIIQTVSWGLAIALAIVIIPLIYGLVKLIIKEIQSSK